MRAARKTHQSRKCDSMKSPHTSIRFGLGRFNTNEEVDQVADRVISEVKRLRDLSPLYEMAREGVDLKTYFAGMTH